MKQLLNADVLVVGGGTGGTAAAIQAARRGAKTILVSDTPWLGGMLTAAGVSAPDGNELAAFHTGLWGAFLRELQQQQAGGLDNGWVSFFTFDPRTGAKIFADWVQKIPNLTWICNQQPLEILRLDNCIQGVVFNDYIIHAFITIDGTELGDILALAEIPYRWGWELQSEWGEPSAPVTISAQMQQYPIQAPTWVCILQDFGKNEIAAEIAPPPTDNPALFINAWEGYGAETFLNYGRLPGNLFMLNWPNSGNDYAEGVERLIQSPEARSQFLQEARWHSQSFARFIQTHLGRRYGLAKQIFPENYPFHSLGGGAYALYPYYRESRRLCGCVTITEQDILPIPNGRVAPLPLDATGQVSAIAIGNYANDHHYPTGPIPLKPKSIRWGGRWTGTPFSIPYGCLIPAATDGLLVCEKNISVSHMANGATRLQPLVMNIGQAAGMAAALCIETRCQPRDLPVRLLQTALLEDPIAPAAIIPLFNLLPTAPNWRDQQQYYLDAPEDYPLDGNAPQSGKSNPHQISRNTFASSATTQRYTGIFQRQGEQDYTLKLIEPLYLADQTWILVTLYSDVDQQLQTYPTAHPIIVWGRLNPAGYWLLVTAIDSP